MKPLPLSHCIDPKTMKLVADEPVVWEVTDRDGERVGTTYTPLTCRIPQLPQDALRFRTASSPHLWHIADGNLVRPLGVGEVLQKGDEYLPWSQTAFFSWTRISEGMLRRALTSNEVSVFRRPFSSQETQPKGQVKTCATQNAVAPATDSQSPVQSTEAKPVASNGSGEVPAFPAANAEQEFTAKDAKDFNEAFTPTIEAIGLSNPPQGAEVTDGEMLDWLDAGCYSVCFNGYGQKFIVQKAGQVVGNIGEGYNFRAAVKNAMQQPRQSHE